MKKYESPVEVYEYPTYKDSSDHLVAEMEWIELLVKNELEKSLIKNETNHEKSEFTGMYISDDEVKNYISKEKKETENHVNTNTLHFDSSCKAFRKCIDRKKDETLKLGQKLRLHDLCERIGLNYIERTVLMISMSPDLLPGLQKWYGYLQNDISKKRPTIQLMVSMLGLKTTNFYKTLKIFEPKAKLVNNNLIKFPSRSDNEDLSLLLRYPVTPLNIINYLVGIDGESPELIHIAKIRYPKPNIPLCAYYCKHNEMVNKIAKLRINNNIPMICISGPKGSGKNQIVESVAVGASKNILSIHIDKLLKHASENIVNKLLLETRLLDCILLIEGVVLVKENDDIRTSIKNVINCCVTEFGEKNIIVTGEPGYTPVDIGVHKNVLHYDLGYPSINERYEIWKHCLNGACTYKDDEIKALAAKFRFAPGEIDNIVNDISWLQGANNKDNNIIPIDKIHKKCREKSSKTLNKFGKKLNPRYVWEDIVLPPDVFQQLSEICNNVKYKQCVFDSWGFEKKFSVGKGLYVLFAGASGTGKTMSAEIIANDLGIELYKIDLSCVVSKYVGETEQNLNNIFNEAESSNSILFFDEADALFGKRSAVKDAHDKYANIETNFLLQKMDDYEGIVILASNLRKNMDSAFTRRLNYIVEFPHPEKIYRMKIWEKVFPKATPLKSDIDLEFLSNQFNIAGGNIKNIAMSSAFMAASTDSPVGMEHLILATKREYAKMSKLCSKSDFGQYFNYVRDE